MIGGEKRAHPAPVLALSYGLPYDVWVDALDQPGARTLISWGTPGGRWECRELTGKTWLKIIPDENTKAIKLQSSAPSPGGGFMTRKTSAKVRLLGVRPFAGRDGNPGNDDGSGPTARFTRPSGLAQTDPGSDAWRAYASDSATHCLRLVTSSGKVIRVSTEGAGALVNGPLRLASSTSPRSWLPGASPPPRPCPGESG